MRSYIQLEKEFIKHLIKSERGNRKLLSFLDAYLIRSKLIINTETEEAGFKYEVEDATKDEIFDWIINNSGDLEEIIAILMQLILYLEKQGYIASYKMTPEALKAEWSFGQGIDEDLRLSIPFPDQEIVKNLINHLFKEIIPLEPLKDLASHDFVTPEERRFRKQYKLAITGIVISIVIGLSVITLNIFSQYSHKNTVEESSKYIKDAIKLLEDINANIRDAVSNQLSENKQLKITAQENYNSNVKNIDVIRKKLDIVSKKIDRLGIILEEVPLKQ